MGQRAASAVRQRDLVNGAGQPAGVTDMLRSAIVTVLIATFATVAAAETVYKWVDGSGQTHYTDRPPEDPRARVIGVFERDVLQDEPDVADTADEPANDEPTFDRGPEDESAPSPATVRSVQADVERARGEQCKQAQERYKTYVESRRLFRQLPNGQREYLSDAELSQARIEAKQAVDELCR